MQTCFVIQPFDADKFDMRYESVFKKAIESAGLIPYRVDQDPSVQIPIEAIENGIKNSAICLADITEDNPNVWYELGFAYASGKPVVLVCSTERVSKKYPFDIQHKTIISYQSRAAQDFEKLKTDIEIKISAVLKANDTVQKFEVNEQLTSTQGLTTPEQLVLVNLIGSVSVPNSVTTIFSLKAEAEKLSALTSQGFGIGIRRLLEKKFIEISKDSDYNGNDFDVVTLTEQGWRWADANESFFVLVHDTSKQNRSKRNAIADEDIPF